MDFVRCRGRERQRRTGRDHCVPVEGSCSVSLITCEREAKVIAQEVQVRLEEAV